VKKLYYAIPSPVSVIVVSDDAGNNAIFTGKNPVPCGVDKSLPADIKDSENLPGLSRDPGRTAHADGKDGRENKKICCPVIRHIPAFSLYHERGV
jgi:Ni,Fe-hydrogenase III small subunit